MGRNPIENKIRVAHPERFVAFQRNDGSDLGYLAVDTTIGGVCGGGVRAIPYISKLDLCHLAQAMTRKYAFLGIPVGGAKAAVLTTSAGPNREKDLTDFGTCLRPHTRSYSPGKDLGIDIHDLQLIFSAAGLQGRKTVIDSGFYTGFSVMIAAEESAGQQPMELNDCTVAIEGFGSVGKWAGRFLHNRGCRVVAASTTRGAVYNPDGLDVHKLCRLRSRYGDQCIAKYGDADHIRKEDLLLLPVDILVPCALSWSIRMSNADRISARMIIPGANNPVTDAAEDRLTDRGVLCFPDFVSNCGGVLGSMFESAYLGYASSLSLIEKKLRPKIRHLLKCSLNNTGAVAVQAEALAEENLSRLRHGSHDPFRRIYPLVWKFYRSGLIPNGVIRKCAGMYMQAIIR